MIKKKQKQKMREVLSNLPRATWMEIDPGRAEEMLKRLTMNRKLVGHHVSYLAREMSEGRWRINGDTIRFSSARLIDGQHRLYAVVQSGATIWALVVEEIEDDVFDTIDTGRMRQAGDVLSVYGRNNPFMCAAAARFIWYYDHAVNLDSSIGISNHEIVEVIRQNPVITSLAEYISSRKIMRTSSIVAALMIICRRAGTDSMMEFAEKLTVGAELRADDPIRYFRDKWMMESSHRSSRGDRVMWMAVCIKTYNAWVAKKRVNRIEHWTASEGFPKVEVSGE